jgi:murE/murF fusion protein
MSLTTLISLLGAKLWSAPKSELILSAVQDDSRRVAKGDLFVAVKGMSVDGHDFAAKAVEQGAAALVVERRLRLKVPQLIVEDAGYALGILAAHAAGNPGDRLSTVGITGTNGKTTTSYMVEAMLQAAERSPGVLGTVSYRFAGKEKAAPYTTPTPLVLQETLREMESEGCDSAILEVSSAALHMDRLVGTTFDVAAFSNLSQDHLDIHKTMAEYRDAKARLFFEHLAEQGVGVINIDDPAGAAMVKACGKARVLRVSRHKDSKAEIRVLSFTSSISGIRADFATPRGNLRVESAALIGHYNVDNIALAVGIAEAMGLPHSAIEAGVARMPGVPGRVERVPNDRQIDIFVDYAHTPDALVNVLSALRPLTQRRLLCVFGCGGDRDPGKRPQMGAAVAQAADLAIVTSDNPRTEDPQAILEMITPEVPDAFFVDVDRRTAIAAAIMEATPGDVVLIAGKGHEDYQILGTEKVHFDDREEAAAACQLRHTFSLRDILDTIDGAVVADHENGDFLRVVIDGRTAAPGDLYVAIRGERFDGHDYCQQAIEAGATGVLVERGRGRALKNATVIEVEDPRAALGDIARMHRLRWEGTIIGITGSAGKTTTKDLISAALASTGRVLAARGSNNNETGVPLTLLGLRPYHDFAVIEMGMRALGEIDYLASIALPKVSVVVNAGTAHVGVLGSTAAIAKAKAEIFGNHLGEGTSIYPSADPRLAHMAASAAHTLSFGDATEDAACDADLRLTSYAPRGIDGCFMEIEFEEDRYDIELPLVGKHNALNACCALAAAVAAGASIEDAAESIGRVRAPSMRGEIREIAGRKILVDCYNANPASMEAALKTLSELREDQNAFAVLGDMLELGSQAPESHRLVGEQAAALQIPVLAMGEFRRKVVEGAAGSGGIAWSAADAVAAARAALACTQPGDWILLKASRGMKLERVADSILQESTN